MIGVVIGSTASKSRGLNNGTEVVAKSHSSFVADASTLRRLRSALEVDDASLVMQELGGNLHAADIAMILEALRQHEREKLFRTAPEVVNHDLLLHIPHSIKFEVVDILGYKKIGEMLDHLTNEDVVDFLEHFALEEQLHILKNISSEYRKSIRIALRYPKRSAGRIMDTDCVVVKETLAVSEVIDHIRHNETKLLQKLYDIFVVDESHNITGIVSLINLLKSDPAAKVKSVSSDNFIAIKVLDKRQDVAYVFNKYDLDSAPVVDMDGKLVGVITVDSVKYITDQENEETLLKMGGVLSDLDEGIFNTTKVRFIWLFINLITAAIASTVISFFEHEIQVITALAVLMPIAVSMGCNAGMQTITVIIRAMAMKYLNSANLFSYLKRELLMSWVNSLILCAICIVATRMFYRRLDLALVFGASIVITMLTGAVSGVISPVIMKKLNTDPAVTAAVFLTTITEVVAFLSFLGLAKIFLL